MRLPFLDRTRELARLRRALGSDGWTLVAVYGRRRLGKSRLLERVLSGRRSVYYVSDDRDSVLQRASLAREIDRLIPGFAAVAYPGWQELLDRFEREAPVPVVLALDEFPALVQASPELPSLLQKLLDRGGARRRGLVLCGSSQRMMQDLLLDASSALYGRAQEIIRVEPMAPRWLKKAFGLASAADAVEHFAVWGGVPRYWELALGHRDLWSAVEDLVLDPLGVLQGEPERLLRDDLTELGRAASILTVVGQGANRASEIAARLGLPATSLSRPLSRLLELGLLARDIPFGASPRDAKRTLYRVADPLLDFHYHFVEPHRSRLATGRTATVKAEIQRRWPAYLGQWWERLARETTGHSTLFGEEWGPAARWWGKSSTGEPMELDVVAESTNDRSLVLVGEAKLRTRADEPTRLLAGLARKAAACPALVGKRIMPCLWVMRPHKAPRVSGLFGPEQVVAWG